MIFKHKSLSDSIVMKEFEKIAVSKGMAKVSEKSITKSASASYQPSKNLIDDMFNLANGLREYGFEKDASSLEEKVLAYKLAETHLYRAIDEDADDMLDFAHPKKDKVQLDAADGHGEIEDTRSQHKKIIDIVNKQPSKVAMNALAETAEILGLKKRADLNLDLDQGHSVIKDKVQTIKYLKNQLNKILPAPKDGAMYSTSFSPNDVLVIGRWPLIEGAPGNYFSPHKDDAFGNNFMNFFHKSNPNIGDDVWKRSFTDKNSDLRIFLTKENINRANTNLQAIYKEFTDEVNKLPEIDENSDADSIKQFINSTQNFFINGTHLAKYGYIATRGLTNNNDELDNDIRSYIKNMGTTAGELLKLINNKPNANNSDILDSELAKTVAWRFEQVANTDKKNPKYFSDIAALVKQYSGKSYPDFYMKLIALDPDHDLDAAKNLKQLDLIGQNWQQYFNKAASKNNSVVKEAIHLGGKDYPVTNQSPTQPASLTRPVSHTQPASHTQATQPKKSVAPVSEFSKQNPDEWAAVAAMQNSLGELANNLHQLMPKLSQDEFDKYTIALKGTGYGSKGPLSQAVDGEWGPNTQKSLEAANDLFSKLKDNKVVLDVTARRVPGKVAPNPKEVVESAKKNEAEINQVLISNGVNIKDKPKTNGASTYLDSLPADVNFKTGLTYNLADGGSNGKLIKESDFSSYSDFENLLRRSDLIDQDSNFSLNINGWRRFILEFINRAKAQFAQDPKNETKVRYYTIASQLYNNLKNINVEAGKIISARELDGSAGTNVNKPNGATTNAVYNKSNSNADGSDSGSENVNKVESPPYTYKVNITNLYNSKYNGAMTYYPKYIGWLSADYLDADEFTNAPSDIISRYIKRLEPSDILKLNGITAEPTSLVPGYEANKITYLSLLNSTQPTAVNLRNRAADVALLFVVNGLSADLAAVARFYIKNSPSNKFTQAMDNSWSKWSSSLKTAQSRIYSDFAEHGETPKAIY